MKKLNGWKRIGIVLSVLWLFVVVGAAIGNYTVVAHGGYCDSTGELFVSCEEIVEITNSKTNNGAQLKQQHAQTNSAPAQVFDPDAYLAQKSNKVPKYSDLVPLHPAVRKIHIRYAVTLLILLVPIALLWIFGYTVRWIILGFKSQ